MAIELRSSNWEPQPHICALPWPVDPEIPEGHACECGRRWVYQPAHWDRVYSLEELRLRQQAGEFLRGIVPTFRHTQEAEVVPLPKPQTS